MYADVADEVRRNIRAAFHDILSDGMLKLAEEANRVRTSAGTHKMPDQYWQEIPRKYVAVAFDARDGGAWFAYLSTDLEYSPHSNSWAPTSEARAKNEKVVSDILHVGDGNAIPCENAAQSLTIRPNHQE